MFAGLLLFAPKTAIAGDIAGAKAESQDSEQTEHQGDSSVESAYFAPEDRANSAKSRDSSQAQAATQGSRGASGASATAASQPSVSEPSEVDEKPASPPNGPNRGSDGRITLEEAFEVQGRLEKPSTYYVLRRTAVGRDWARLQAEFVPLVLESIDDPVF